MQHPTNKAITTNLPDLGLQGFHNFLRPCQLRFIHDPSRERIVRKSRQIGVSHNAAYDLVHEDSRAANPSDARLS
jgi:phage FluMu gp28-like protein